MICQLRSWLVCELEGWRSRMSRPKHVFTPGCHSHLPLSVTVTQQGA